MFAAWADPQVRLMLVTLGAADARDARGFGCGSRDVWLVVSLSASHARDAQF